MSLRACQRVILVPPSPAAPAGEVGYFLASEEVPVAVPRPNIDVLALSEALDMLETRDVRNAALVKLRYFAGLTKAGGCRRPRDFDRNG